MEKTEVIRSLNLQISVIQKPPKKSMSGLVIITHKSPTITEPDFSFLENFNLFIYKFSELII
jgi:hypothetical protein